MRQNFYNGLSAVIICATIVVTQSQVTAPQTSNYMWNLQTGRRFYLPDANAPIAISPDGRTIITAENFDTASLFHWIKIWRSPGS